MTNIKEIQKTSFLKKILPIGFYCIYLLLFLEIAARFALSNKTFFKKISTGRYVSDAVWRHMWVQRQKKEGVKGEVQFTYDKHHPVLGWVPNPNFTSEAINVNAKGVRGKIEFPYERIPNRQRILILGESYTWGTEVRDHETYSHYLQKMLPNKDIINMGVHGYGFDQMLIYFNEEGKKYRPDIVLVPILEIDKKRSLLGFRDYAKPTFRLARNGDLKLQGTPIATPREMYVREFFKSKLIDLIRIGYREILVKKGIYQKREAELTRAIFLELVDEIRSVGAVPIFVYLEGIRDSHKKLELSAKEKDFFKYWISEYVYCIYILPYIFSKNAYDLDRMGMKNKVVYFKRKYGHFSPREHLVIAYGIKDTLTNIKVLK